MMGTAPKDIDGKTIFLEDKVLTLEGFYMKPIGLKYFKLSSNDKGEPVWYLGTDDGEEVLARQCMKIL